MQADGPGQKLELFGGQVLSGQSTQDRETGPVADLSQCRLDDRPCGSEIEVRPPVVEQRLRGVCRLAHRRRDVAACAVVQFEYPAWIRMQGIRGPGGFGIGM